MNGAAIARIEALAKQAQAAHERGDKSGVAVALTQLLGIAADETLTATRVLGAWLVNSAASLCAAGEPNAVLDLFRHAHRVLVAAADTRIDDLLLLWHNLGVFYSGWRLPEQQARVDAQIAQAAHSYDGPLQAYGVNIFLEHAMARRESGDTEAMRAMLRQVHRWRMRADASAEDRSSWLEIYANLLQETGRTEEAAPILAQAIALARELGLAEREAGLHNLAATIAHARGDGAGALAAADAACALIDTPALAHGKLACRVLRNRVALLLNLGETSPALQAQANADNERSIATLHVLGAADGVDMAQSLYHRGVLCGLQGDERGAAQAYREAAGLPGASVDEARDWLTLAGRAHYQAADFEAASACYLAAVRRRVQAPAVSG